MSVKETKSGSLSHEKATRTSDDSNPPDRPKEMNGWNAYWVCTDALLKIVLAVS